MVSSLPATNSGAAPAGKDQTFGQYGNLVRRRWIFPATIIPASLLVALFFAFHSPGVYRATGTIMLQPSEIPAEMVSSTVRRTPAEDDSGRAQQEVELLRRRVMTPESLRTLVAEIDPYPGTKLAGSEAKALRVNEDTSVERVDPITLKPLDESTAFSIHYDNPDPRLAAAVAQKLVDLYLTYNRRSHAEQAAAAYDFLHSQAKDLEASMVEQEQKLAHFKTTYGNSLPDRQQHNLSEIDRVQRDLEDTRRQLLVAEEKESELQLQLNNLSPSLTAAVDDWRTQLAKLRSDLAAAQLKYTDAHPEVKRLKRAIAEMAASGQVSLRSSGAAPDNPEYLSVQNQLRAAQRAVAALRGDEAREHQDIDKYESGLSTEPNVEREYTQLQRDYDNSRARYEDLQAKMKNAALARTMEQEERGEKFTLLQAPTVPHSLYSPNRLGIILLGMVLGCGIAFGLATAVDAADPTVRGTADLQEITGATPMGAIPWLLTPQDVRRRKLGWSAAIAVFGAASLVLAVTILARR
ncbi:MAG: hypothetical protein ACRD3Q_18490 [Terriglobales bacterium]